MNAEDRTGITVVGSANMDVVFGVQRIPLPGETLLAQSVAKYPGGKGLNQAVAAARAGAETRFIGAVGTDDNGDELAKTLAVAQIDSSLLRRVPGDSGQAFIVVAESAENTIIVASGSNASVVALTESDHALMSRSTAVLLQLELPMRVVEEAARVARNAGTLVILNAAPAHTLGEQLLGLLDYLIVNEHEACVLGGTENLAEASVRLASTVRCLIVTLGENGSVLYENGRESARITAIPVTAVDTTGAGDTYCGAFAAATVEGRTSRAAIEFATAAAALSVQKLGAVPSIPARAEIDDVLMGRHQP